MTILVIPTTALHPPTTPSLPLHLPKQANPIQYPRIPRQRRRFKNPREILPPTSRSRNRLSSTRRARGHPALPCLLPAPAKKSPRDPPARTHALRKPSPPPRTHSTRPLGSPAAPRKNRGRRRGRPLSAAHLCPRIGRERYKGGGGGGCARMNSPRGTIGHGNSRPPSAAARPSGRRKSGSCARPRRFLEAPPTW